MSEPWWRSSRQAEEGYSSNGLPAANAFFGLLWLSTRKSFLTDPETAHYHLSLKRSASAGERNMARIFTKPMRFQNAAVHPLSNSRLGILLVEHLPSHRLMFLAARLFGSSEFIRVCLTMVSRLKFSATTLAHHTIWEENHG